MPSIILNPNVDDTQAMRLGTYNDNITPAPKPLMTAREDIKPPKKRKTIIT